VDHTDLAQHMNNFCAVVNAIMNILPSATVLPNSISGSANKPGEIFFILFDVLLKFSFYVICESNRNFVAMRFGSVRFVVISCDLKALLSDKYYFLFPQWRTQEF
jgi:hypothetical protein